VRGILFVLILLLSWVSVHPFSSLSDQKLIEVGDTSDLVNQFAYVTLAGIAAIYFLIDDPSRLRPLLRPVYLAMLAWLLFSVATSTDPGLSARRLIFALLVILLAAALPLLATSLKRFGDLTAAVVAAVLALSYAGLLIVPDLAIHQPTDIVEPLLAGNWRGVFNHKNIAGPMMVNFIFIGLYVAKARSVVLGWSIVAASAVFLVFCEAKSATALLPIVLILSWVVLRVRSTLLCAALVFLPTILLNVSTIGSLYFDAIRSVNEAILPDPSFTGRNDIWQFAVDNIRNRPWLGHGFGAFWETPQSVFQSLRDGSQASYASHAHNAFLDLVITVGIPGLVLGLLWTLVLPFRDMLGCKQTGSDLTLTTLFVRIWLFGVYTSSFESVLFDRGDSHWFTMLVAMFGLRYLSVLRLDRR
jgi:O-antigen ligase